MYSRCVPPTLIADDPEADNEEVDSSSGCGIMCAEYLEDLLVYEDVESKDSVEGGLDFEAEPDSSSDEGMFISLSFLSRSIYVLLNISLSHQNIYACVHSP